MPDSSDALRVELFMFLTRRIIHVFNAKWNNSLADLKMLDVEKIAQAIETDASSRFTHIVAISQKRAIFRCA